MIGPIVILVGVACGVIGWLLLRQSGSGWRIGRLLAAAPHRSLEEAGAIAASGEPEYVRLHGRVESDEEFPGDGDRPVVYRRRRLQRRSGRKGWETFDDERLAVPFALSERGVAVAIDVDALGEGLVVVPRVADGVAADLTQEAAVEALPEMAPETPVRLRIEQVSTVDHATATGVPQPGPDGTVLLGPGLGRPLLLTVLDVDEAMRVLASDQRRELLLAAALLVAAPIVVIVGLIAILLRI
jgi:hypothetical protein